MDSNHKKLLYTKKKGKRGKKEEEKHGRKHLFWKNERNMSHFLKNREHYWQAEKNWLIITSGLKKVDETDGFLTRKIKK